MSSPGRGASCGSRSRSRQWEPGRPGVNPHPRDGQGASEKGRGCPSVPRAGLWSWSRTQAWAEAGWPLGTSRARLKMQVPRLPPICRLRIPAPVSGNPRGWGTAEPTLGSPQRGSSWAPPGSSPTLTFPECEIPHLHGARSQAQHRRPATRASGTVGTLSRATPTLLSHPIWGAGASFPPPALPPPMLSTPFPCRPHAPRLCH